MNGTEVVHSTYFVGKTTSACAILVYPCYRAVLPLLGLFAVNVG